MIQFIYYSLIFFQTHTPLQIFKNLIQVDPKGLKYSEGCQSPHLLTKSAGALAKIGLGFPAEHPVHMLLSCATKWAK